LVTTRLLQVLAPLLAQVLVARARDGGLVDLDAALLRLERLIEQLVQRVAFRRHGVPPAVVIRGQAAKRCEAPPHFVGQRAATGRREERSRSQRGGPAAIRRARRRAWRLTHRY